MKKLFRFVLWAFLFLGVSAFAGWPSGCGSGGQKTCTGPIHYGCEDGLHKCDVKGDRDRCVKHKKSCDKYANWPKSCGGVNQKTCLLTEHPFHSGCKKGLHECDLAGGKRNICKKSKSSCPVFKCKKCGNNKQKPCLFNPNCHMCTKGYSVSVKTGRCSKSPKPEDVLLYILEDIDKSLKKYEKNCRNFGEHILKALDDKAEKELRKIINSNHKGKSVLNSSFGETKNVMIQCGKGSIEGFACGALPWLSSYNEMLIALVDTTHEKHAKKHTKGFKKFTKKFTKNFLHNKKVRKIHDPVSRMFYAFVLTIDSYGKDIKSCSVHVFKDVKNELKHEKLKKPTKKQINRFVKNTCYNLGSTEFTLLVDQVLAFVTAEAGEAVEGPKDAKAFISLLKKIANEKVELENDVDEAGDYFKKSGIKGFMKKHKTCKVILDFTN